MRAHYHRTRPLHVRDENRNPCIGPYIHLGVNSIECDLAWDVSEVRAENCPFYTGSTEWETDALDHRRGNLEDSLIRVHALGRYYDGTRDRLIRNPNYNLRV